MKSLKRHAVLVCALTLSASAGLGIGVASAASPSQSDCEAAGGTFTRTNGTVSCVYPTVSDPVGNSESSGGKSQTRDTTKTEGGQGNINNKDADTSTCTGPGNSGNC